MPDMTGNPYLTDPRFQLSPEQKQQFALSSLGSALTNFGAGIAQGGASGQPWFAGIGPGAAMASGALGQQEASMAKMQQAAAQYYQMEDYRKSQEAHIAAQTEMERRKMAREDEGFNLAKGVINNPTGFNMQPPSVQTSPTGFGAPPADLQKVGPPMVNYLMSKAGLPPVGAAAAVGGLYQESGFNPGAVGDKGTANGMAQWRGERLSGLTQFAQSQGKPATDPQVQLDYMIAEMKGGDMGAQRAYALLQQAKTPEEGTAAMMHFFRPAGYTPNNPQGGHAFAQRVGYSTALLPQTGPQPGQTMASVPAFQGPGMPSIQPGATPPGMPPQMNPASGAPPGMAVGDGGPPGSPANGPQVAQAPQQPGSFDPGPMPQPDPRIKGLMMYPGTKALGEQMQKDYETQIGLWKYNQTEARQGRNEEMKLRQEADKLKQEGQKMVPFGPGQNYEPSTDTVYVTDPIAGNSSYKLHGGTPPAQSEVGTPEPANPNAPPVAGNEDFLKTLPPATANLVKAYAEGRMPIPTAAALRNPSMARLMAAVQQYDPSFDAANYQARKSFLTSSTSGSIFNNVIAPSNKFLNHASSYLDAYDKLNMGGGLTSYVTNPMKLGELKAARSGEYMSAETNLQGVKDEFAKFMGGKGQLTDLARKLESDLSITSSPAETYATIGKMKELMQGQLEPVAQQRKELFKQGAPGDFIQPKGQEAIARIDRGPSQPKADAQKGPPGADFDKYEYRPNPNVPSGYDRRLK